MAERLPGARELRARARCHREEALKTADAEKRRMRLAVAQEYEKLAVRSRPSGDSLRGTATPSSHEADPLSPQARGRLAIAMSGRTRVAGLDSGRAGAGSPARCRWATHRCPSAPSQIGTSCGIRPCPTTSANLPANSAAAHRHNVAIMLLY